MPRNENLIVALDVGTSKVTTLVANVGPQNTFQFAGKGVSDNKQGIISGSVVNMEATREAVQRSIDEAEKVSDQHIKNVFVGLSGEHITSINSHGVVTVKGNEVAQADIERVIEQAKNISLPGDRKIVAVEVGEFIVDEQSGIKNPRGMAGKRLEVKVHIVTASIAMIQNLVKSVTEVGVHVEGLVVNGLASSFAVLEEDEKQLGVALIDIGEGTTDITVFRNGNPVYTAVLPIGGKNITMDISYALRIPPADAEKIKCGYGSAVGELVNNDEEVEVPTIGGGVPKIVRSQALAGVIAPRVEDIMVEIRKKINSDVRESHITSGVVLTGGTAKLKHIQNLAEDVLGLPVRVASPVVEDDSFGIAPVLRDPAYASSVGIVYSALRHGNYAVKEKSGGFFEKLGRFFEKFFQ